MSNLRIIEPREGYTLTNGNIYSKKVYLGINDAPENWHEILDSEVPDDTGERVSEATLDDYADALAMLGVSM